MNKPVPEKLLLMLCFTALISISNAQTSTRHEFTIQQAVDYAHKNNSQVKNALLGIQI